ncbi:MAG: hypothetical protein U0470_06085 [Anaerolineae bacterium]
MRQMRRAGRILVEAPSTDTAACPVRASQLVSVPVSRDSRPCTSGNGTPARRRRLRAVGMAIANGELGPDVV